MSSDDDQPTPTAPAPSPRLDQNLTERELESALRFMHVMEVQGRVEQRYVSVEISSLVDLMIAKGLISARELEDRRERARREQDERESKVVFPRLAAADDKYKVAVPDIPCLDNLVHCKGACCRLQFFLSPQDLDEGVVKWQYDIPYRIRQDASTGYCTHYATDRGCTVYEKRPGVCRAYDCRSDKRIWADYESRTPSEDVRKLLPIVR